MRLDLLAEKAMDLYYKDYKQEGDFFDLDHFKSMCVSAYGKLLLDEFNQSKLFNKQIMGFSFVDLSQDWLRTVTITPKKVSDGIYKATLPERIFSFPFDAVSSGIQRISSISVGRKFVKVSSNDEWKIERLPATPWIFYYLQRDEVIFRNVKNNLDKATDIQVLYVPDIDSDCDDFVIPTSKELQILSLVLQLQLGSKDGEPIDTTNNMNPNKIEQTEIDNKGI